MVEARKLTNAERCSLFLLDHEHHELVAKVFDGISTTDVSKFLINKRTKKKKCVIKVL